MSATEATRSIYENVGGEETFQRLVAAFYRRVEKDALLRPMYPEDLWGHETGANASGDSKSPTGLTSPVDRLAAFLAQFFGGPTRYSDHSGHPRLRMRHVNFKIGQPERDAWLAHMCAAIQEVGIQEPAASVMRQYFDQTSTFLINVPTDPTGSAGEHTLP